MQRTSTHGSILHCQNQWPHERLYNQLLYMIYKCSIFSLLTRVYIPNPISPFSQFFHYFSLFSTFLMGFRIWIDTTMNLLKYSVFWILMGMYKIVYSYVDDTIIDRLHNTFGTRTRVSKGNGDRGDGVGSILSWI